MSFQPSLSRWYSSRVDEQSEKVYTLSKRQNKLKRSRYIYIYYRKTFRCVHFLISEIVLARILTRFITVNQPFSHSRALIATVKMTSRFTGLNGNLYDGKNVGGLSRNPRGAARHATFFTNGRSFYRACLVCVVKRKNCYGRAVTLSKHGSQRPGALKRRRGNGREAGVPYLPT